MDTRVVIVGGGQAAVAAASKLRELDSSVTITIVSDEPIPPYQRPPLSKKYLSGEMPLDRLLLRPLEWFDEQGIELRLNSRVEGIERDNKSIVLYGGERLIYDKVLLATGSNVRRLPEVVGGGLDGVYYLRSTSDSDAIHPHLQAGKRLVVVGGGYIGLEVAAIAAQAGLDVTIVEMADRILQRVAAPETSDYYRDLHQNHGVKLLEGTGLAKLVEKSGRVTGAELADGTVLDADLVLVGIGVIPAQEIAESCGLITENGISVNTFCQTSDLDIYAAGDCASFSFNGQNIRLESVPNAIHQAEVAVRNMVSEPMSYVATPWFWSDQYDVKLQIAGLNAGYDSTVLRPGKREGAQSIWYYKGENLLAVDAMNDAPSFMMARKILEAGKTVPKEVAGDATSNLKEWV